MKKFLGVVFSCVLLAAPAFGSTLVFKLTKQVKSDDGSKGGIFLTNFDASKYKQIRIGILFKPLSPNIKPIIAVYGLEDGMDFFLAANQNGKELNGVIDSPPPKLGVRVSGDGEYSIYIWASE